MNKDFTGIVLSKDLSGESGLIYRIFSPDDGILVVHKRTSSKKTSQLPDFFDEISGDASKAKTGDILFLNDFEINKRRTHLAWNYESFCAAADIAKLMLKNSRYLEHFDALYVALSGSFDALEAGASADIVMVKFMYVFARDEGYPVKQSFAKGLSDADFNMLSDILSKPALQCNISERESARMLMHLERWIYSSTDIEQA